jgi:hypothetical protein
MKNILIVLFVSLCSIVQAQIVDIPDANFKNTLVNEICADLDGDGVADSDVDTNNDLEIQVSEAEAVLGINVESRNISSLEGIQSFVNLANLRCPGNDLTTLDLNQNANLEVLDCSVNLLTTIDVSQNPNLIALLCYLNQLTTINVSQNPNLITLICPVNSLTTLDVSQNLNLDYLDCANNNLTTLGFTQNPLLRYLDCRINQLTTLDVSQNPNLTSLYCNENELNSLNLKNGNNVDLNYMHAPTNPNLSCIQVDDVNFAQNAPNWVIDSSAEYRENCTLGVQNIDFKYFTLIPNPTQGILNISTEEQIETIRIFSLQGELLKQTSNTNIDVSYLSSGLYFVQVSASGKSSTKKFVKI